MVVLDVQKMRNLNSIFIVFNLFHKNRLQVHDAESEIHNHITRPAGVTTIEKILREKMENKVCMLLQIDRLSSSF